MNGNGIRSDEDAPKGLLASLFTNWTGRILLLNTIIFLIMTWQSGSLFDPGNGTILMKGAKDSIEIVNGEYWRFITPIFIHIGLIHYLFNSYILYYIGNQLEGLLGAKRYLIIFIGSGILGNVASAILTPVMSAGASSSIFGLLGCGFYIERTFRRKFAGDPSVKSGSKAYAMTILINLVFGFVVPFIDNAAHIGGLIGGFLLTVGMIHLRPSRIVEGKKKFGTAMIATFLFLTLGGIGLATNRQYVSFLFNFTAESKDKVAEKIFYYSRLLVLDPSNNEVRLTRAKILIENGETTIGYEDINTVLKNGLPKEEVLAVASELEEAKFLSEAEAIRGFVMGVDGQ
jgi:rhomboid protease GluP